MTFREFLFWLWFPFFFLFLIFWQNWGGPCYTRLTGKPFWNPK